MATSKLSKSANNANGSMSMGSETDTDLQEVKRVAKEIREQHESSGSVFHDRKPVEEEVDSLEEIMARERFSSLYEVDFYPKKVSPSEPRPCSVTRRNNPHPSEMFLNWKVPTRLIVDEPSYHQQKQRLLKDSSQRFYEDVNGSKKYDNPSHDVLNSVSRMRRMHPSDGAGPTRRVSHTSTTHHCPPQGMLKQLREKDIEDECLRSVVGRRPTPLPTHRSATPRLPPMMSGKIHQDPTKESMARLLRPRAVPAAAQWLRGAGRAEKQVVGDALKVAETELVDKTLARSLQPEAKKAVQKWLETATEKDRDVAIEFFGSLAGSKLMGAREGLNHSLHKNDKGGDTCRICDGDRLNQVLDALKKGNPVAAVTLRKDMKPGDMRRRHIRLLTPNTRAHKQELRTWHHLPVYQNTGPISNSFAMFTRPHRPVPRHFTIHPEWE